MKMLNTTNFSPPFTWKSANPAAVSLMFTILTATFAVEPRVTSVAAKVRVGRKERGEKIKKMEGAMQA